jgi:hypothetical protein
MIATVPIALSGIKFAKNYKANKVYNYMKIYSIAVQTIDSHDSDAKEFNHTISEQLNSLNPIKSSFRQGLVRIDTIDRNDRSYVIREPDEKAFPPDWEDGYRVPASFNSFPASELRAWRKLKRQERSLNRFAISTSVSSLVFLFIWLIALGGGSRVDINENLLILLTLAITYSLTNYLFFRKRSIEVSEFRKLKDQELAEEAARETERQRAREIRDREHQEFVAKLTEKRHNHEIELNRRLEKRNLDENFPDND